MALIPYFERDGIVLYHGDCREVLPQLQSETFDLVLTDPPYLVNYTGRWGSNLEPIEGDSDASWVAPVYCRFRVLKPDSLCLTFYGWPHADTFVGSWKQIGFRPISLIVLIKTQWDSADLREGSTSKLTWLAKGRPPKPEMAISDVLEWERNIPQLHPNQKPLRAVSKLVGAYSSLNEWVLDPFCGSGTTLLAARAMGRHAIGIEIDERSCELIALRLSQRVIDFPAPETLPEQLRL